MSSGSGPVTCVVVLVGVGLYFAPDPVVARVRGTVADLLRPGQIGARRAVDLLSKNAAHLASHAERSQHENADRLKDELNEERSRTAALQIRLARLADNRSREQQTPEPLRTLPRLASTSLIDADILGNALAESWRSGKLLDRGEANGVRESALVLKSSRPLVDLGDDGQVSPEDALLLGRCVIGKIERVGRWTSTFLLVTDSDYRGRAQLVHQSEYGFVYGAKGLLKGQGKSQCRLDGIASSQSVAVGDAVYTTADDGLVSTPLYYGRVTEATLGPDDREWNVQVEPIPVPRDLATVQILRTSINSQRLAAGWR